MGSLVVAVSGARIAAATRLCTATKGSSWAGTSCIGCSMSVWELKSFYIGAVRRTRKQRGLGAHSFLVFQVVRNGSWRKKQRLVKRVFVLKILITITKAQESLFMFYFRMSFEVLWITPSNIFVTVNTPPTIAHRLIRN